MMPESSSLEKPAAAPLSDAGKWAVLWAAFLGWMFDGLEMGLFPLAGGAALKSLLGPDADIKGWFGTINALFLVGAAFGGLAFGWLGDRIGRVRAMSASILVYAIFTGLGYFVTSAWQLAALRFVASIGMGGEWALGVALVMEAWPSNMRPLLAGFIGAASNVGFLVIAVIGLLVGVTESQWRWIMLAGAAPALLTFYIQSRVPESQKWKDAASVGGDDPLKEVFGPRLVKNTLIAICLGGIALLGTWGSVQWIPTWVREELLKDATPAEKSNAASWLQIASAIGAILGCFAGSLLGGRLGRRPVYFALCLLSLGLCQFLFRTYTAYSLEMLFLVGLIGFTTAAFYGWLPLYLPELFPTRVRATGQGIAFNMGRLLAAGGVLSAGWLVNASSGSWAAAGSIVSMVYALGLVVIWFAPETRGKPLPE